MGESSLESKREHFVLEVDSLDGKPMSPLNTGRWTEHEHDDFIKGLKRYGKNWDMLAYSVKTRSATQVRSHAQKYFLKCAARCKRKLEPEYVSLKQNTAVLDLCIDSQINHKIPQLEFIKYPSYCALDLGPQTDTSRPKHVPSSYTSTTLQQCTSILTELSNYEFATREQSEAEFNGGYEHNQQFEPLPYKRPRYTYPGSNTIEQEQPNDRTIDTYNIAELLIG